MPPLNYRRPDTPGPTRRPVLFAATFSAATVALLTIWACHRSLRIPPWLGYADLLAASPTAWCGLVAARRALDTDREAIITTAMCLLLLNGIVVAMFALALVALLLAM